MERGLRYAHTMSKCMSREAQAKETSGDDDATADLLGFVLGGRPERVTDLMIASMPVEARAASAEIANVVATLAVAEPPAAPSASLRSRLLATVAKKRAATTRRAVLVCDMQNDHLEPGKPLEVPRARAVVPALARRLDQARAAGVPVVYVLDQHDDASDPEFDAWPVHNVKGTRGAEVWPPLAPKPGDRQVTKPSFSSFFESHLEKVLEELGVDTLVLTGCATEVQIMATATDAMQKGFAVEVPADSQAGASEAGELVAMATIAALAPYQPARRARLEKIAQLHATAR
jgi:nicotinamidase/pyrazinamidase